MKQIFLSISFVCVLLTSGFAQLNFKSLLSTSPEQWRTENTNHYHNIFDHTTLGNIQASTHRVELRFLKDFGHENLATLVQIYLDEKKGWQAMIHGVERKRNGELHLLSFANKPINGWTSLWHILAENNLWQLPDDDAISSKKKKISHKIHIDNYPPERREAIKDYLQDDYVVLYESLTISGGHVYEVDLKLGPFFRFFNYCNPEAYLGEFPEIEELQYFSNILNGLRSEFKIEF